jgi:hypothetical protein
MLADLKRFTVFRCKCRFDGEPEPLLKRFVCIGREEESGSSLVVALKTTSKLAAYRNNPALLAGSVHYQAGVIQFFEKETVIQIDKRFPFFLSNLMTQHATGDFVILGSMPERFIDDLSRAIAASVTLSPKQKRAYREYLGLPA